MEVRNVNINQVTVYRDRRRPLVPESVARLARSIERIGLKNPITLYRKHETSPLYLIAGYHRLEPCKELGHTEIFATIANIGEWRLNLRRSTKT